MFEKCWNKSQWCYKVFRFINRLGIHFSLDLGKAYWCLVGFCIVKGLLLVNFRVFNLSDFVYTHEGFFPLT